jgi:hypothetical protein
VARVEIDLERLFLLRRQVGSDELLGAALDEGLDPAPQAREPLAVAVAFNRPRVLLGEPRRVREEPRRGDREQATTIERPDFLRVSVTALTASSGVNFAASPTQFETTLVGATIRNGPTPGSR